MEENKEDSIKTKKSLTHKCRENPWIVSTVVLGVLVLIFLVGNLGVTGNVISEKKAGETILSFANSNGADAELVSVDSEGDFYVAILLIQEQEVPVYITKDGKYFTSSLFSLEVEEGSSETEAQTEVSKSDVPEVGLYIWSYCPYGVTALEPFAQVALLLEDYADFRVYLYYAGHGDFEVQQNKIQACIQEKGYDAYWEYAETFATEIYDKCYGDADCNLKESVALMDSLGIDSDAVLACVESQGESLLEEHYNAAKQVSVTGSPSLVINGAKVSSARNAEAYKDAVCSAFNDAPEACSTELSSTGSTASGNC